MRSYKRTWPVLLALAAAGLAVAAALSGQRLSNPASASQGVDDGRQWPIADYAAPEPTDPEERARRRAIGERYDRQKWVTLLHPTSLAGYVGRLDHSVNRMPALPVAESEAVVVGEVIDAQAFLSNDKSGVYTEFTVRILETLKNDAETPLVPSATLAAARHGGRVQFPTGHITRYAIHNLGMPRVGKRYVLFLKRKSGEPAYFLYTGYELRGRTIYPIDGVDTPGGGDEVRQFARRKHADQDALLNEIREAVASLPRKPAK